VRAEIELTSVNRKQLEVRLSLPKSLTALESRMVEVVQESISRGQVSGSVEVRVSETLREQGLHVNRRLAQAFVRELRSTARGLKLRDDLSASLLLNLPGVVTYSGTEEKTDVIWPVMAAALRRALAALMAMREREGLALAADIRKRFVQLARWLEQIQRGAPGVTNRYRTALRERLAKAGVALDMNDPQLLKELAIFAERSDISEEITRLRSHFKQADTLLKSSQPAGRALDFLAQEMFREINTIGSKANDAAITRHVIRFKTELERIREQVQNVE
jgi:uncharacterized protein (TIGR00255 family)